jgi:predicted dehydrogenase
MPVNVAMVGMGYWGKNLVRVFNGLDCLRVICDQDRSRASAARKQCPNVAFNPDYSAVLADPDIKAVVLATPAGAHFEMTRQALEADKDVLVEKPLALKITEAEALVELAESRQRILMVGHTFLYNDAVRWAKDFMDRGELGEVYYAYFQRLNLGRVRQDVNAMWNLAPHDVSICHYWYGETPTLVKAHGVSYLQDGIDDVSFMNLTFPSGRAAHIHVSWLDPFKTRRAVIVGSKKMLFYDDTAADQKITVFDKGIDRKTMDAEMGQFDDFAQFQLVQRAGDIWIPRIDFREPLTQEARHFLDCVQERKTPMSDGRSGLEVVRTLELAQHCCEAS